MRAALGRIGQAAIVIAVVATLTFFLLHLAPGDPFSFLLESPNADPALRAKLIADFGFDQPVWVQFARYVANLAHGDLGIAISRNRPVATAIADALPYTLVLMGTAIVVSFSLGVALGVAQAAHRGSVFDRVTRVVGLAFYSMPDFWLALVLLIVFARWLHLLPAGGATSLLDQDHGLWWQLGDRARRLVLPALTLVLLTTAGIARLQRAALLDVLPEEYVRTAAAKGVGRRDILLRHALRNALVPVITLLGLALPALIGGAVFVERIFGWPGMGDLMLGAVESRDYLLVTGCVLAGSVLVVVGSAAADIVAMWVDPRQRIE